MSAPRKPPPASRLRQRARRLRPLCAALATSAALLAVWCGPLAAHVPRPGKRLAPERDRIVRARPGAAPLFCNRRLDEVGLLVLGDSRVSYGLRAELLEDAGFEQVGILWGGAARLADLIDGAERASAARIVLALSPMSFYAPANELREVIAARPAPELAPGLAGFELDRALERWTLEQTEHLVAAGLPREPVAVQLLGWSDKYRADYLFDRASPAAIDRALGDALDLYRALALPVVEPGNWRKAWFDRGDPHLVDRASREHFAPATRPARDAAVRELAPRVAELARSRALVCVRLPMSPSVLAIEEGALASEAFADFCARAGVAYLDYSAEPYETHDGTHLTEFAARRLSRALARDLRAVWPD